VCPFIVLSSASIKKTSTRHKQSCPKSPKQQESIFPVGLRYVPRVFLVVSTSPLRRVRACPARTRAVAEQSRRSNGRRTGLWGKIIAGRRSSADKRHTWMRHAARMFRFSNIRGHCWAVPDRSRPMLWLGLLLSRDAWRRTPSWEPARNRRRAAARIPGGWYQRTARTARRLPRKRAIRKPGWSKRNSAVSFDEANLTICRAMSTLRFVTAIAQDAASSSGEV